MVGKYFCDVCDHWFNSDSSDEAAQCPGCGVDVLDIGEEQPLNGYGHDHDFDVSDYE
jgi:hypothetical protein